VKKKAAISKTETKFEFYLNWLKRGGIDYEVLDWRENNFDKIKECSSLVLTGGVDIFPEFYADWEDGKNRDKYSPQRDGFEFRLADYALENKMPLLAICRGLQLINCKLNGSLINDIETIRGTNHRKLSDTQDRLHEVTVFEDTLLYEVVGKKRGRINSSHHQSVDRVGEGLMVTAKAPDGIIEAAEWADKNSKPFFLGIQWHPERMQGGDPEFTDNILKRLKEETEKS
jgi:putative glutamine amidotransferase